MNAGEITTFLFRRLRNCAMRLKTIIKRHYRLHSFTLALLLLEEFGYAKIASQLTPQRLCPRPANHHRDIEGGRDASNVVMMSATAPKDRNKPRRQYEAFTTSAPLQVSVTNQS